MVVVEPEPSALDATILTLYVARDAHLSNLPVIVLHGPSTTTNSTLNTSRIQAHIFSLAGFQSFPRLTISPTSTLYSAVHCLPVEDQGDEISRGLAISLFKYFSEIPKAIRECIQDDSISSQTGKVLGAPFDAAHAASLASQMERVEDSAQIINHLLTALSTKSLSWIDIDLILPPNSISRTVVHDPSLASDHNAVYTAHGDLANYGKLTEVVELFGQPSFIPTSKLRRAPSKPTGGNKSRFLSDEQRAELDRDLQEVLETERSYVLKIQELATVVSPQFAVEPSFTTDTLAVLQLFPPSLRQILDINTRFLSLLEQNVKNESGLYDERDVTKVNAFATLLLNTVPEFHQPYVDYIKASSNFSTTMSNIIRDHTSRNSQQIHQIGEQRLRSWLIEPVQRLPRYILFIENVLKKLPIAHPAISQLIRAKDLISQILDAQELDADNDARMSKRLQSLVLDWPTLPMQGRLVTAVDVVELQAPYVYDTRIRDEPQGMLLLFPNDIVVLRKISGNALSARGLMAEIDRPRAAYQQPPTLTFAFSLKLDETTFTESNNGHCVCLASISKPISIDYGDTNSNNSAAVVRVYALTGSFEGKAARWQEEIARARIEHRFPEHLREDYRWTLRSTNSEAFNLGIVSAVFETNIDDYCGIPRQNHGRIQVMITDAVGSNEWISDFGKEKIKVQLTQIAPSMYRLEIRGFDQHVFLDNVHIEDLLAVFLKQMSNLQRILHQPIRTSTAQTHIAINRKIVETIRPNLNTQPELRGARFRPISPVKVLSNFLGGIRDQTSYNKLPVLERSNSKQSLRSMKDIKPGLSLGFSSVFDSTKAQPIVQTNHDPIEGAFVQLEKTFNTYIVAMQSRCGNVVGKVIRNRASADEVMVNELYNILLEDPSQYQATAEVSVDVLFAAFEKFLNRAWRAKIGPLLPTPILTKLEEMFNMPHFGQIESSFKALLQEMTPQNRRAFSAITKLLYDLLDASGNDGDRGAITAAVSEALFQDVDYLKYIPLLDRMVDNIDSLFDDIVTSNNGPTSQMNSVNRRVKATTPGSISSTTSSFKKRFGFGTLSRENSKNDSESRVGQILRNLSKKATGEPTSQPSSLSKAFLSRSKSIDDDSRRPFFSRPASSASKVAPSLSSSRPNSSHQEPSDTIAPLAKTEIRPVQLPKKKRRSSLSDISSLRDAPNPEFLKIGWSRPLPPAATPSSPLQDARQALRAVAPQSPVDKPPSVPTPQREIMSKIPSPIISRKIASPSPARKENIPPLSSSVRRLSPDRNSNVGDSLGNLRNRDLNSTQKPTLKPGLSTPSIRSPQRSILSPPASGLKRDENGATPKTGSGTPSRRILSGSPQRKSSGTTQKLKMQSPQKLRERLEREKKAINEIGPSLQQDIAKLGDEISLTSQPSKDIRNRMEALENKTKSTLNDLMARNAAIQLDVDSSLIVSEKKAKSLDEVYREANAENELLYDRFNTELMRVLDAVKSGAGLQEMKTKLKEAQDEAARLRKDNQRLKRENLGLRSQLR